MFQILSAALDLNLSPIDCLFLNLAMIPAMFVGIGTWLICR